MLLGGVLEGPDVAEGLRVGALACLQQAASLNRLDRAVIMQVQ